MLANAIVTREGLGTLARVGGPMVGRPMEDQGGAPEQAKLILQAAVDPSVTSQARKEDCVKCLDHFDLL